MGLFGIRFVKSQHKYTSKSHHKDPPNEKAGCPVVCIKIYNLLNFYYTKYEDPNFLSMWDRESFVLWWTWIVRGEAHQHAATAMDREMTGKMQAQKVALRVYIGPSVHLHVCLSRYLSGTIYSHNSVWMWKPQPYHTCCWPYRNTKPRNKRWDNIVNIFCCLGLWLIFFFFPLFICLAFEEREKKNEALLNVSPQKGFLPSITRYFSSTEKEK